MSTVYESIFNRNLKTQRYFLLGICILFITSTVLARSQFLEAVASKYSCVDGWHVRIAVNYSDLLYTQSPEEPKSFRC